MSPHLPVRLRQVVPLALALLSVIIAAVAYLQALHFPFVSDDLTYITTNNKLAGLHLNELWRLFTEPYNEYEFLPLRDLSYWLDIKLFGLNPAAFRAHNIFLYLLCLPLVYSTTQSLWRYFRPTGDADAPWVAAIVTALFAMHPVHVESVVWISGRKDVLSGLFSLLALWLAVNARQSQGLSPLYASGSLLALLAAMLSKATAVAVAPVIALLWLMFWRGHPTQRKKYRHMLWPAAILLLAVCVGMFFTSNSSVKEPFHFGTGLFVRALAILGWLARLSFSPESRHWFYPVLDDSQLHIMIFLGMAVIAAMLVCTVSLLRNRSLGYFAVIAFVVLCLPYLQLIPFYTTSLASDRFLMLAVWPAMLLVVALSWQLNYVPRTIILLVFALAWCYQTAVRTGDWRGLEALVDSDVRAYPGYYQPAFQKIWIEMRIGKSGDAMKTANSITVPEFRNIMVRMIQATDAVNSATPGKPDEVLASLQNFDNSLNNLPDQSKWNTPMRFVRDVCRNMLALKAGRLALQFPDNVLVRYKAGVWKLEDHNYKDAIVHLRAATESQQLPESLRGAAYKNLGMALLESGHAAEAEHPLRTALEQSPPDLSAYCPLSMVYKQAGRHDEETSSEAECRRLASSQTSAP
jgi:protein O-mannosyl-transferase